MSRIALPFGAALELDADFPAAFVEALRAHVAPFGERFDEDVRSVPVRAGAVTASGSVVADVAGIRALAADGRLTFETEGVAAELSEEGLVVDLRRDAAIPRFVAHLADPIVAELAARTGRLTIHAASIAPAGRALLLAGPGGSGKSTLFRQAAASGLPVLSDDLVFASRTAAGFVVEPFPRGAPYDPIAPPGVRSAPLAAIVFPEIGRASTSTFERVPPELALARHSEEARSLDPAGAAAHFARLVALVAAVPAFRFVAADGGGDAIEVLSALAKSQAS